MTSLGRTINSSPPNGRVVEGPGFFVPEQIHGGPGQLTSGREPTGFEGSLVEGQEGVPQSRIVLEEPRDGAWLLLPTPKEPVAGAHGGQEEPGCMGGCFQVIVTSQCDTSLGKRPDHITVPRRQHLVVPKGWLSAAPGFLQDSPGTSHLPPRTEGPEPLQSQPGWTGVSGGSGCSFLRSSPVR